MPSDMFRIPTNPSTRCFSATFRPRSASAFLFLTFVNPVVKDCERIGRPHLHSYVPVDAATTVSRICVPGSTVSRPGSLYRDGRGKSDGQEICEDSSGDVRRRELESSGHSGLFGAGHVRERFRRSLAEPLEARGACRGVPGHDQTCPSAPGEGRIRYPTAAPDTGEQGVRPYALLFAVPRRGVW